MLSTIFVSLLAIGTAVAAPGAGGDWTSQGGWGTTSCSTSLCTSSSVYQVPTTYYSTETIYVPYTTWSESEYYKTETLTETCTETYTSTSTWVVTYQTPVVYSSVSESSYLSTCTESTQVPVTSSSASTSVCTTSSEIPVTTQWVETQTVCSTGWNNGGWGSSSQSGW